ncbi:hypothetical protein EJA72_23760 [Pseudomonas sp. PB120]|nr:hypothetical protein [Pseudomonas sp. PB120]
MDVNDNATCLDGRGVWAFIASRLAPTFDWGVAERDQSAIRPPSPAGWLPQGECVRQRNQVGFQAAELLILIWLLIFLRHREAEWRFCAVGNPAWMPG